MTLLQRPPLLLARSDLARPPSTKRTNILSVGHVAEGNFLWLVTALSVPLLSTLRLIEGHRKHAIGLGLNTHATRDGDDDIGHG